MRRELVLIKPYGILKTVLGLRFYGINLPWLNFTSSAVGHSDFITHSLQSESSFEVQKRASQAEYLSFEELVYSAVSWFVLLAVNCSLRTSKTLFGCRYSSLNVPQGFLTYFRLIQWLEVRFDKACQVKKGNQLIRPWMFIDWIAGTYLIY